jgi:hypothetical protein
MGETSARAASFAGVAFLRGSSSSKRTSSDQDGSGRSQIPAVTFRTLTDARKSLAAASSMAANGCSILMPRVLHFLSFSFLSLVC